MNMEVNYASLISDLVSNQDAIVKKLKKREGDVALYFYINEVFAKNEPVSNNIDFRERYKSFYVMRTAGLTEEHFNKYFELLDKRVNNLETILNELYAIKTLKGLNSFQFSFATKLLHTLDNNLPIYDKLIKKTLGLPEPYKYQDSNDKKLRALLSYYENLKRIYAELLGKITVKQIIEEIREHFGWAANEITDVKILDFILWVHSQK